MAPVSDTSAMIAGMNPERMPGRWAFRTIAAEDLAVLLPDALAVFREAEGISALVPANTEEAAMAQITLKVFSSLEGIGLTAAVSTVLAEAGIACNVIAATLHDHIFVPEDRADEAIALLKARAAEEVA
ncbi:ACT domain-containing protein [Gymnodinialimonas hymeniacidonis]|uniref:ACT domain-containing protein n=1 Tax=Gymnodinialimonas hymeniacidonis TaxID=3126508 RepID=UPI0034C63717